MVVIIVDHFHRHVFVVEFEVVPLDAAVQGSRKIELRLNPILPAAKAGPT